MGTRNAKKRHFQVEALEERLALDGTVTATQGYTVTVSTSNPGTTIITNTPNGTYQVSDGSFVNVTVSSNPSPPPVVITVPVETPTPPPPPVVITVPVETPTPPPPPVVPPVTVVPPTRPIFPVQPGFLS